MPLSLSSPRRALVAGVASAGLLTGAFLLGTSQGSASSAAPGSASSAATGSARTTFTRAQAAGAPGARITVTGTGTVSGTPNQLLLSMGVQTSGGSVAAALTHANAAVRAVTGALSRTGVRGSDIQTSGLFIQPNYAASSAAPDGYSVNESIQVTLRRLAIAGTQISDAVRAGGNATVIDGVSLNLSDTSSLLAAARARAVADAKTKAGQYARAAGLPLGPVVSISETPPPQPLPVFGYAVPQASGARPPSVPVHPGSQQLSVTVTVVFVLG